MRNCPKWNSDKMTLTNLVTHVLKWVMSQVLTEKATTKTESKYGIGVRPNVSKHAGNENGVFPTSPLARWVREVFSQNSPYTLTTKLRLEICQHCVEQTLPQSRVRSTQKRGLRCSMTSRQHHTHTFFYNDGASTNVDFSSSRSAQQFSPRLS